MNSWQLGGLFFYSHDDRLRELRFETDTVNIITGSSGTGKSAILQAIDYCLGSTNCHLPQLVRWRSKAVGTLWTNGTTQIFSARLIPLGEAKTSTKMYVEIGGVVEVPQTVRNFRGDTNVEAASREIGRRFGIGEVVQEKKRDSDPDKAITVRHSTPYIFVSKNVIDSDTVLFHGYDDRRKYDSFASSLPFFLGAIGEETIATERRLRGLRKSYEYALARTKQQNSDAEIKIEKAKALAAELVQIGAMPSSDLESDGARIVTLLREVASVTTPVVIQADESAIGQLYEVRQQLGVELKLLLRKRRNAIETMDVEQEFGGTVKRQIAKAGIIEKLNLAGDHDICPVCQQHTTEPTEVMKILNKSLERLRAESEIVDEHRPALASYISSLSETIRKTRQRIIAAEDQIRAAAKISDVSADLQDRSLIVERVRGRISYFLQDYVEERRDSTGLERIAAEIAELTAAIDVDAKDTKLRWAESEISREASRIMGDLPTEEPCKDASLQFLSKGPDVVVRPKNFKRGIRLPSVGSDQNYLAIHVSLYLAMQHFFAVNNCPVPRLLIIDQISRPYFPQNADPDEKDVSSDEDMQALRQHIKVLFDEVEQRKDLQVILLEKTYFSANPKYAGATLERWNKKTNLKLIPDDWPEIR
jgi:hypothetical protein